MVEEYHGYEYLAKYILPQPDLYGLNALAEKLSELTDDEAIAFHGLVQMEAGKSDGKLSLQAHSFCSAAVLRLEGRFPVPRYPR